MNIRLQSPTAAQKTRSTGLMTAVALVAVAGIAVSSVSLHHHFGTSKTSFCDFGQAFNCDLVNRSRYSTVVGVPVALIGVLGYLLIFALGTIYRSKAETPVLLAIASLLGLAFSLYLTYIEKFVLTAWCILCISSLALITIEAVLSSVLAQRSMGRG
jgi:vitamin-K-epoxide reductase (warfarin-sensitive)